MVMMGSNVSSSYDNQHTIKPSIPTTLLPLNTTVKVHLVPKFLTSDGTKFDSKYCMLVKVTQQVVDTTTDQLSKHQFTASIPNAKLSADVEFQQRRFSLLENTNSHRLLSRTKSYTLEQSDIKVENVDIVDHESIRISGTFIKGTADVNSRETFDLVLFPSKDMEHRSTDCGDIDWILMGTLFTKAISSKYKHHWRAAVRANLD